MPSTLTMMARAIIVICSCLAVFCEVCGGVRRVWLLVGADLHLCKYKLFILI